MKQATQRVRKAYKRNIPVVELEWLRQCRLQRKRLDFECFRLDEETEAAITSWKLAASRDGGKNLPQSSRDSPSLTHEVYHETNLPQSAWSDSKDLGCCCVCHENGNSADCDWCPECIGVKPCLESQVKENSSDTELMPTRVPCVKANVLQGSLRDSIELGCCCVCHDDLENGNDCEWCKDCNRAL